jgi:hypothetical protein
VFLLVFAGYAGAAATAMALWPHGTWTALALAPVGGSVGAALAGGLIALRHRTVDADAQADAMVADLRALVARAERDGTPAAAVSPVRDRDAA